MVFFLWLLIPFLSTSLFPLQVKSRTNANGTVAAGASPALTNSPDTIASIRVTSHSNVLTVTGRSQDRTISRFTWRDTEWLQTEPAMWMDVRVLFWCCRHTAMVEGSRLDVLLTQESFRSTAEEQVVTIQPWCFLERAPGRKVTEAKEQHRVWHRGVPS